MSDYEIPNELRFSPEDEWVRVDGEEIVIGITDFAQQQLGDIVFLELPAVGTVIEKGQAFGTIESVKAVSDLFAPVSGEVTEVNDDLGSQPELVNDACYAAGWILRVAPSDTGEADALLDAAAYIANIEAR